MPSGAKGSDRRRTQAKLDRQRRLRETVNRRTRELSLVPKRIYVAAAIHGQNITDEKNLATKEKVGYRKKLEVLSTASVE